VFSSYAYIIKVFICTALLGQTGIRLDYVLHVYSVVLLTYQLLILYCHYL